MLRVAVLLVLLVPGIAQAQLRTPSVPPLPQDERLVPRTGLSVRLLVSPSQVTIDEVPTFTIAIRNTSARRVFLNPAIASNIQIFDDAGRFVAPTRNVIADMSLRSIRVADLITLEPGATHNAQVHAHHHQPDDFGRMAIYSDPLIRASAIGLSLPPGSYTARFRYHSFQDYGSRYAEAMPADLWEGTIETPPVSFTVLPLDQSRIDRLNAEIDGPGPAVNASQLSSLTRASETVDAWLRRFGRASDSRSTAVAAITALGDPTGVARLIELTMALPEDERGLLIRASGSQLGRAAPGCTGVPWLIQSVRTANSRAMEPVEQAVRDVSSRCPNLLAELRASVQQSPDPGVNSWAREATIRANILELLGRLGDRRDIPLLLTIARAPRPANIQSYARRDFEFARGGALRGLASVGGQEAADAILERLRATASDMFATRDAVELAGRLPLPEATPVLVDLLSTTDPTLAFTAMRSLQQRGGRDVTAALEVQLKSPQQLIRQNAAGLLRLSGTTVSLSLMRETARDGDAQVRAVGLFHLSQQGDSGDLPLFIANVTNRTAWDSAAQGIERFGTAAAFAPLRALLDTATQDSGRLIMSALQRLTFAPIGRDASEWDAWWASHSTQTRADWAREVLASNGKANFSTIALQYLASSGQLSAPVLESAIASRDANVRLTAARIVGESDPRRAALLMVREFENRSIYACQRAVKELNTWAARSDQLDCTSLVEREAARKQWTARAETLRP
jgi:HEAT repeat protein